MKIAIVGAGLIVHDFFGFAQRLDNYEFESMLSSGRNVEEKQAFCHKHNIKKLYTNYDELLCDDKVETVYVALPNHLHYAYARKALCAGKHVILEKPCTSNLAEFMKLYDLAKAKKRYLLEAISNQYQRNFKELRDVALLQIGEVKIVEINFSQYSSRYERFKAGEIVPVFDPAQSGGALMDLNVYNIHLAVGLFGKPDAVNYFANVEKGIDTSGILMMDYGSFKVVSIAAKDSRSIHGITIQGNEGSIYIDGAINDVQPYRIELVGKGLKREASMDTDRSVPLKAPIHRMQEEFIEFERMIREDDYDANLNALEHSRIVMEVIEKAKQNI
ncbi:Gfo/Idh/MocA family oxidoreductase [Lachnospiraceae bacterium ZAX-1]